MADTSRSVSAAFCGRKQMTQGRQVGAKIVPTLSSSVDIIAGIKEPPVQTVHDLIASNPSRKRTWMVFSHTHKGQVSPVTHFSAGQIGLVTRLSFAALQHPTSVGIPGRKKNPDLDRS